VCATCEALGGSRLEGTVRAQARRTRRRAQRLGPAISGHLKGLDLGQVVDFGLGLPYCEQDQQNTSAKWVHCSLKHPEFFLK